MDLVGLGLEVMGMGLAGVFVVLILFYFMIKLLIKVFPPKEE
ncbi:OadG family protein [Candidatus Formimonas warabiya]|nr:OadG family protein [Candidatus Formimonas warabiya]